MVADFLDWGKIYALALLGRYKSRLAGAPKKSLCQKREICGGPVSADPIWSLSEGRPPRRRGRPRRRGAGARSRSRRRPAARRASPAPFTLGFYYNFTDYNFEINMNVKRIHIEFHPSGNIFKETLCLLKL